MLRTLFVLSLAAGTLAQTGQDRFTLKSPNGIAFSEFRGYDTWQDVAVSQTDDGIKVIVANPAMMKAYNDGAPENGKPFPDGSMIAKIEWTKEQNPASPYAVTVPGTLKSVAFIEKDSKRFADTNGWGYAQLLHDSKTSTFKPYGDNATFGKTVCHACHTTVKDRDYIFTAHPKR
jgi:hypothetical protein